METKFNYIVMYALSLIECKTSDKLIANSKEIFSLFRFQGPTAVVRNYVLQRPLKVLKTLKTSL